MSRIPRFSMHVGQGVLYAWQGRVRPRWSPGRTYRFTTTKLKKFIGGLRVGESSPARVDAALRSMRNAHGATMARQSKTILRGALQLAVMASARNFLRTDAA